MLLDAPRKIEEHHVALRPTRSHPDVLPTPCHISGRQNLERQRSRSAPRSMSAPRSIRSPA